MYALEEEAEGEGETEVEAEEERDEEGEKPTMLSEQGSLSTRAGRTCLKPEGKFTEASNKGENDEENDSFTTV